MLSFLAGLSNLWIWQCFLTFNTENKLTYIAHINIIFALVGNHQSYSLKFQDKCKLPTLQTRNCCSLFIKINTFFFDILYQHCFLIMKTIN
jgi:hypothetical protein